MISEAKTAVKERVAVSVRSTKTETRKLVPGNPPAGDLEAASSSTRQPSQQEIAFRAYDLFLARGRANGQDLDDWLQAERQLAPKVSR